MASMLMFSRLMRLSGLSYRAAGLHVCRPINRVMPARVVLPLAAAGISTSDTRLAQTRVGGAGKHWRYERIASIGLLAMIPTGLVAPNMLCDYGIAVLLPIHNHWGFESIIVDYVPKSLQLVSKILLYAITLGTFGGLMYLNYNDVGICRAVRMLWTIS